MATITDVMEVLGTLYDANLNYPPKAEKLEATARVWVKLLAHVPAANLRQAALDWIALESDFPKLADIRKMSEKVHSRNGASVAGGVFKNGSDHEAAYQRGVWARNPFAYWAMIEAEYLDNGRTAADIEAEWRETGVKTFGDIEEWRHAQVSDNPMIVQEAACTA